MRLRRLMPFSLILLPFFAFSQQRTVITGKITNLKDKMVSLSYTPWTNNQEVKLSAELDKKGNYKISFKLDNPVNATFGHGSEETHLFLEPGDSLDLTLDTRQFDETVKYAGKGATENNFLAQNFLKYENLDRSEKFNRLAKGIGSYLSFTDSLKMSKLNDLKVHEKEFNPVFMRLFKDELDYEQALNRLDDPGMFEYYLKRHVELGAHYYDFLDSVRINNDSALMTNNYKAFTTSYLNHVFYKLLEQTKHSYQSQLSEYELAKILFTGKTLRYVQTEFTTETLDFSPLKDAEPLYLRYKEDVPAAEQDAGIAEKYERKKKLTPGNMAPDFQLKDIDGKTVSLSDFRGKLVYMDFWASWCGPCMHEMPSAKLIHEQFKDKNIVFLYVSIDEDEQAWKDAITKKGIEGVHLITKGFGSDVAKLYEINGVPMYYLIGTDGKIMDDHPPRPSDIKLPEVLNMALKH